MWHEIIITSKFVWNEYQNHYKPSTCNALMVGQKKKERRGTESEFFQTLLYFLSGDRFEQTMISLPYTIRSDDVDRRVCSVLLLPCFMTNQPSSPDAGHQTFPFMKRERRPLRDEEAILKTWRGCYPIITGVMSATGEILSVSALVSFSVDCCWTSFHLFAALLNSNSLNEEQRTEPSLSSTYFSHAINRIRVLSGTGRKSEFERQSQQA